MIGRSFDAARGALGGLWRGVDLARRATLNLLFLVVLVVIVALALSDGGPRVPSSAALVIAPEGRIVEQLSGDALEIAIGRWTGDTEPQTLGRDLVRALAAARDDDRIKAVLIDTGSMTGARLAMLQDLRAAISDFKESGKPVVATSDFFLKSHYHLAAAADEIFLTEMGMVILDGYGRFRAYHKDGLDRLEIDPNVIRVGEYKSATEPYLRNDMSDEAREANLDWLGDLWASYLEDVAAARGLEVVEISAGIDALDDQLRAADGDTAQLALERGLVDVVGGRDVLRDRMIDLVGEDERTKSFHQIGHAAYLEAVGPEVRRGESGSVAVVVASGTILNGDQPPGTIGGDSTAALVRAARQDDDVAAIVLRVDSGGGSAFASELIRRELALAREAGKKVVVSMAGVAASGGYWISTASDQIWASPTTITGSIGIFGMLPTFEKPLARFLGTRIDGVGTTWISGQGRPDRALDPRLKQIVTQIIEKGYRDFLERVSEARGLPVEDVDRIARGRVWSGADALRLGLVDELGGLDEAIDAAAALAELGDDYGVVYVEKPLRWKARLAAELLARTADLAPRPKRSALPSLRRLALERLEQYAGALDAFDDPFGAYAYCFCDAE